jgi:divalent metal cation (Fe/Co/Zn/Cd) transporter
MHRFGHGNAKSLAALIQALLLAGAVCVLVFEQLHRLPHATHTSSFDGSSGHGKSKECLRSPVSEPALPVRPLFD